MSLHPCAARVVSATLRVKVLWSDRNFEALRTGSVRLGAWAPVSNHTTVLVVSIRPSLEPGSLSPPGPTRTLSQSRSRSEYSQQQ